MIIDLLLPITIEELGMPQHQALVASIAEAANTTSDKVVVLNISSALISPLDPGGQRREQMARGSGSQVKIITQVSHASSSAHHLFL